jgi:hypothetical protein
VDAVAVAAKLATHRGWQELWPLTLAVLREPAVALHDKTLAANVLAAEMDNLDMAKVVELADTPQVLRSTAPEDFSPVTQPSGPGLRLLIRATTRLGREATGLTGPLYALLTHESAAGRIEGARTLSVRPGPIPDDAADAALIALADDTDPSVMAAATAVLVDRLDNIAKSLRVPALDSVRRALEGIAEPPMLAAVAGLARREVPLPGELQESLDAVATSCPSVLVKEFARRALATPGSGAGRSD